MGPPHLASFKTPWVCGVDSVQLPVHYLSPGFGNPRAETSYTSLHSCNQCQAPAPAAPQSLPGGSRCSPHLCPAAASYDPRSCHGTLARLLLKAKSPSQPSNVVLIPALKKCQVGSSFTWPRSDSCCCHLIELFTNGSMVFFRGSTFSVVATGCHQQLPYPWHFGGTFLAAGLDIHLS